ncbi:ABC transporter ATP-binding protein [Salinibacterium hongtaonis]|uniref:ABC transporter ATP-binding protein n=1 Tax=Homoserinimonas hongtaonis TaxID=2079791 RepID=A0A2U1T122_9MICO|nr:ABC transporter ATP-binding protein [Salinibacterium hongtaonis]AWB90098.1 multidrug ABC transporter ATP-binding protein [Salinibacterium hongtaonis]PWB97552.1 ABC transporter ATP-binding protein [Salinibacterium hongtaonis]
MSIIDVRNASKSFKGQTVLADVSLTIERGRSYGLCGPNGSGKSVLLQMLCGLIAPDTGSVSIDSSLLSADRTFPDRFGISINGPAYLAGLSAIDNLLDLAAIRKRDTRADCEAVLDDVGLDPRSRQRVRTFSLGMKQKLALAQAFIESPEVLLLDEPFNALDEESVQNITTLLRAKSESGTTIVMTSHHRSEIDAICDSIITINGGKIRADTVA